MNTLLLLLLLFPAVTIILILFCCFVCFHYITKEKTAKEKQIQKDLSSEPQNTKDTTLSYETINYYDALEKYYLSTLNAFIMQNPCVLRWNFVGNIRNASTSSEHDILITFKDGTAIHKTIYESKLSFAYKKEASKPTPESEPTLETSDSSLGKSIKDQVNHWFTTNHNLLEEAMNQQEKMEYILPVKDGTPELLSSIAEMLIDLGCFSAVAPNEKENIIKVCKPLPT